MTESQELRLLRHAFAASPGSEAFVPLAEHLCDVGRPEEAEQICRKGLAYMPGDHPGHRTLARALCDRGRLKEAQDVLAELAKHRTEDPEVWVHLAAVVVRRGDRQRARALLEYAESLGATGTFFDTTRTLAVRPATAPDNASVSPLTAARHHRTDDRPKPVAGVLFSKTSTTLEATVVLPRRRPLTLTAAAIAAGVLLVALWLLL